jgi:hypothetical protein
VSDEPKWLSVEWLRRRAPSAVIPDARSQARGANTQEAVMAKVTVYGASDDLIEVEGDIREEFNPRSDDVEEGNAYLAFSDGTVLKVKYDGCWRITPVARGSAEYQKTEATDEDKDYSDKVTLEGEELRWVVYGNAVALSMKRAAR